MKKHLILPLIMASFSMYGSVNEGYPVIEGMMGEPGLSSDSEARAEGIDCGKIRCREFADMGRSLTTLPEKHKAVLRHCCCDFFVRNGRQPKCAMAAMALDCQRR